MIHGIVYNIDEKKFTKEQRKEVIDMMKIQIDNHKDRLRNLGRLVIISNINFGYRGFKSIQPKYISKNKFLNKHFGLLQLLEKYPEVWIHDLDLFQMHKFKDPEFGGYDFLSLFSQKNKGTQGRILSDSSMFARNTAIPKLKEFIDFFDRWVKNKNKKNFRSGELYWNRFWFHRKYRGIYIGLDWRFNMKQSGRYSSFRYNMSTKPIIGIHLTRPSSYGYFLEGKNELNYKAPDHFKRIFDQHLHRWKKISDDAWEKRKIKKGK